MVFVQMLTPKPPSSIVSFWLGPFLQQLLFPLAETCLGMQVLALCPGLVLQTRFAMQMNNASGLYDNPITI